MKRSLVYTITISVLIIGIAGWVFFVQPEVKFRKIAQRYPRGTPAQKILNDYGGNLQLHRTQNDLGPDASEEEKRRCVGYYLAIPKENAYLFFNYHQELLRIMKASDALKPQ